MSALPKSLPQPLAAVLFDARKLTPALGSEVHGVDLKQEQSEGTIAAIRALLVERGVVFFPDQHLDPAQHLAFTARFGQLDIPAQPKPNAPLPGISVFDSRDGLYGRVPRWHADVTSKEAPPTIEVFQTIVLPETGGDTLWASTAAAYDRLAEPLKRLAESLTAIHAFTPVKVADWGKERTPFHWAEHPVVTIHPESGRKALYLSPRYAAEIVGVLPHESAGILKLFNDHITQPETTVRYRWSVGTVAMWDNRSTLHYAVDDYGDALRIVHRAGIVGQRPIGVRG